MCSTLWNEKPGESFQDRVDWIVGYALFTEKQWMAAHWTKVWLVICHKPYVAFRAINATRKLLPHVMDANRAVQLTIGSPLSMDSDC